MGNKTAASMSGRKSSNPIGRRTKTDVLKDKNVRKDDDGQDCFEDYWTDTDTESTVFSRSNWTLRSDCSKANLQSSSLTNKSRNSLSLSDKKIHSKYIAAGPNFNESHQPTSSHSTPGNEVSNALHSNSKSLFSGTTFASKHSENQVQASVFDNSLGAGESSSVKRVASNSHKKKPLSKSLKETGNSLITSPTSFRNNESGAKHPKKSLSVRESSIQSHHSTSTRSRPANVSSNALQSCSKSVVSKIMLASKNSDSQVQASVFDNSLGAGESSSAKRVASSSHKKKPLSKSLKEMANSLIITSPTSFRNNESGAKRPEKSLSVRESSIQSHHSTSTRSRPENVSNALQSYSKSVVSKTKLASKNSDSQVEASNISASNQGVCHVLDLSINPTCPVDDLSRHHPESCTSESSGKSSSIVRRGRKMKDVYNVCETEATKRNGSLSKRRADQAEDNVELSEKKNKKQKLPKRVEKPAVVEKSERPLRNRYPPLAHWRNERILYQYKNGDIKVLGRQEGTAEDNAAVNAVAKKLYQGKKEKESNKKLMRQCITGSIYNIESDEKVTMKLGTPYHSVPWHTTSPNKPYRLKKMLSTEAISFGYLELQGLQTKETQFMPTEDLHFVVIQGRVQFLIQENKFETQEKDMIIVPKCVAYSITNLENRKSLLYFSVGKFKCLESCG